MIDGQPLTDRRWLSTSTCPRSHSRSAIHGSVSTISVTLAKGLTVEHE
jgi:hypothetical protein